MNKDDLDARRKARARAWLERWRAEREKAQKERRPMRYVAYDYTDDEQEQGDCGSTQTKSE